MALLEADEASPEAGNHDDADKHSESARIGHVHGWRFAGLFASLSLGLLLAITETFITATALVTIGKYFDDSVKANWVVLAYLLSYIGFTVIIARLSDGIGRLETTILAWVLFGGASLANGFATSLNQLIGFRAVQGIGGSGLYTMTMIVNADITPSKHWATASGLIGIVVALGSILGPILGGAITTHSTWRWIYLFNGPGALLGIVGLLIFWPHQSSLRRRKRVDFEMIKRVDLLGAVLLLAASTLLVFSLQEAGGREYPWSSATIKSTLSISAICWVAFSAWMFWLSKGRLKIDALVPLRIAISKPTGPAIIAVFASGFPFFVVIINLSQRFQITNANTSIMAGVHLLPLLCSMAIGSALGGALSSKRNLTSHSMIAASCLILLGCGLMSMLNVEKAIPAALYGYEFILGLGIGLTFSAAIMIANLSNDVVDVAAAQGAINQARMLGGSIGLAVGTIVLNHKLERELTGVLQPSQLQRIMKSLGTLGDLSKQEQAAVGKVYGESYNEQMRICTYVAIGCVLASLATFSRHPVSIAEVKARTEDRNADRRAIDVEESVEVETKS